MSLAGGSDQPHLLWDSCPEPTSFNPDKQGDDQADEPREQNKTQQRKFSRPLPKMAVPWRSQKASCIRESVHCTTSSHPLCGPTLPAMEIKATPHVSKSSVDETLIGDQVIHSSFGVIPATGRTACTCHMSWPESRCIYFLPQLRPQTTAESQTAFPSGPEQVARDRYRVCWQMWSSAHRWAQSTWPLSSRSPPCPHKNHALAGEADGPGAQSLAPRAYPGPGSPVGFTHLSSSNSSELSEAGVLPAKAFGVLGSLQTPYHTVVPQDIYVSSYRSKHYR